MSEPTTGSKPITDFDHSVAFSCLLDLYPWYREADSRHTSPVTDHLVEAWRTAVAAGDKIDCYALAKVMGDELKEVLDRAVANSED